MKQLLTKLFDKDLKKLLKNALILFTGNTGASIIGILTLAIVARAIGPEQLGVITFIQTIIILVGSVLLPKPWMSIVKFGTTFREKGDLSAFRSLISFSFKIEVAMSVLTFIFCVMAAYLAPYFELDRESAFFFLLYSIVLLFQLSGTSMGILRMFNKFKMLSMIAVITAIIKLFLIFIIWLNHSSFIYYLIVYIVSDIIQHLFFCLSSVYILKKEAIFAVPKLPFRDLRKKIAGFYPFTISMHFNDILGTTRRNLDFIIIGLLLSTEAVGFYKIIKQFGKIFSALSNPLKQTMYPEACRLLENEKFKDYKQYINKATLILVGILLLPIIIASFGIDTLVSLVLGEEYLLISSILLLYLVFHSLFLAFQTLNIALLSRGRGTKVFSIELLTNIVYFALMFLTAQQWELLGVVLSFGVSVLIWIIINLVYVRKEFKLMELRFEKG